MNMDYTQTIMHYIEVLGIISFASSGAILGIRKHMDPFGVCVLGCVTALGGGIIRDV
ncbi:MAG: TRIC cation channel family protein, partial [Clostridia bacterium]|nr:TRIC cation channel family protein [Clostridia bacterium]